MAEEKKKTKSDKLYSDSPTVKRDKETGEAKIQKPSEADKKDAGLSGDPLEGAGHGMPIEQHEAERASMHKRHEEELSSMHDRHRKDLKEMHKRHEKGKEKEPEKAAEIKKDGE